MTSRIEGKHNKMEFEKKTEEGLLPERNASFKSVELSTEGNQESKYRTTPYRWVVLFSIFIAGIMPE